MTNSLIQEKIYDQASIEALPSITETALAMLDGDPELLMDACVFFLNHRPDRWEEIAEHYRIQSN
jgi:hypothetical protein